MRTNKQYNYFIHSIDLLLIAVFVSILLFRFYLPFYWGPFHWLENDPGRHWEGGIHFFDYTITAGSDPKIYEVYLYLLQKITGFNHFAITFITGLLSASMPVFWYLCAREILPKQIALVFGIVLGTFPSLLTIYSYFMNETLLLTLLGLGMWLSFRSYRKKTLNSFLLAVFILGLASLTRVAALPIMIMCLGILWLTADKKLLRFISGFVILAIMYIPSALHTYKSINIFSPFGSMAITSIYKRSNHTLIEIEYPDKNIHHVWGSPSFYNESPFEPFYNYVTPRAFGAHNIVINTLNGRQDWDAAYNNIELTFAKYATDVKENFIYFFFGGTWPDNREAIINVLGKFHPYVSIHVHSRWVWLPLMIIVLLYAPLLQKEKPRFIIFLTFTLIIFMIFQQSGVMEGRFRKPIEPFMLLSFFIVFYQSILFLKALFKKSRPPC